MPNWVHNSVTVMGDETKVKALYEKISAPRPEVTVKDYETGEVEITMKSQPLSFWNIFAPEDVRAYHNTPVEEHDYHAMPNGNWYDWNCKHWGTKWDASNFEDGDSGIDGNRIDLAFDTAWSHPEPIINWFVSYCQENGLELDWSYEEEQGWGGEILVRGVKVIHDEWDIPESHADWDSRGRECPCEWSGGTVYEDCPKVEVAV